jgi:hypothetical protein
VPLSFGCVSFIILRLCYNAYKPNLVFETFDNGSVIAMNFFFFFVAINFIVFDMSTIDLFSMKAIVK